MYDNFENLHEEKKKKILDVCIYEFANKGYDKASTNSIVKEAGISKGILFHYFKSKKNLFFYLLDYCIQEMMAEYEKYPLTETKDIFQRISEMGMIKLKLAHQYPYMVKLFMESLEKAPQSMRSEIEKKYNQIRKDWMLKFFKNIDFAKFRNSVDPIKATQILILFMEALSEKYLKDYKGKEHELFMNYDKIMAEYMDYIEIVKYGMYSPEAEG